MRLHRRYCLPAWRISPPDVHAHEPRGASFPRRYFLLSCRSPEAVIPIFRSRRRTDRHQVRDTALQERYSCPGTGYQGLAEPRVRAFDTMSVRPEWGGRVQRVITSCGNTAGPVEQVSYDEAAPVMLYRGDVVIRWCGTPRFPVQQPTAGRGGLPIRAVQPNRSHRGRQPVSGRQSPVGSPVFRRGRRMRRRTW